MKCLGMDLVETMYTIDERKLNFLETKSMKTKFDERKGMKG